MSNVNVNKVVQGGLFLTLTKVFQQFSSLFINVVLARLLLPDDFGLIALVTTYIGFIILFINVGFGASIIQNQQATRLQISTLYWLSFLLAAIGWLLVWLSAGLAADFYNEPRLPDLVAWVSLTILISPVYAIHYKLLEKELQFSKLSWVNLVANLLASVLAILAAWRGMGVYSLVVQTLVNELIKMLVVLFLSKWRPVLIFDWKETEDMVIFSLKNKLATMLNYVERNIDYLLIGKLFEVSVLGVYAFAYNIMYTPVKRIAYIFTELLFPSFASLQDDPEKLRRWCLMSMELVAVVSFPMMTFVALNADWLIIFVFGEKWIAAVPIIAILSYAGAIQAVGQIGGVVFPAIGKPEVLGYLGVLQVLFLVLAVIIGAYYKSITWLALAIVFAKFFGFVVSNLALKYYFGFSLRAIALYLKGPVFCVLVMNISYSLFDFSGVHYSFLQSTTSLLLGLFVLLYFNMELLKRLFGAVFKVIRH